MPDYPPDAKENPYQKIPLPPFVTRGAVVGTIHSPGGMRAAQLLPAGTLSAAEIRLDAFSQEQIMALCQEITDSPATRHLPMILTPRCASEGGQRLWDEAERLKALQASLPWGTLVDLELQGFLLLPRLVQSVLYARAGLILSYHDFKETPSADVLLRARDAAAAAGADIFKVATTLRSAADITALLALLDPAPPIPTAVMAMGPLGQSSRLLLADAGSVLNYGWLDEPQVSGQWSAAELHELFVRLGLRVSTP
jgi:3-dehydroquinate dehydratase-1